MHLFLIRHGETEHNVAGLLAGVTDSRLTNHGVLQAQRLGKHLATTRQLRFTHIYASDLQRAWMTADELRKGQRVCFGDAVYLPGTVKLDLLREQDFGSLEMTSWASKQAFDARTDPGFKPKETAEAMKTRADQFIDDFLGPLWALADDPQSQCVAVVSHGLFLAMLWRRLIGRFEPSTIQLGPEVGPVSIDRPLEYIAVWTNTGFLELEVISIASAPNASTVFIEHSVLRAPEGRPPLSTLAMRVVTVNGRDHLLNLQRTRGGVGSAAHDTRQKQIDGFFKRPQSGA
jgi:broad specificity phosphatase PhoE